MNSQKFPKDFPILETDKLILRKLNESDAEAFFKNYSDEDITRNFLDEPLNEVKQAVQFIEAFNEEFAQREAITWAIVLKTSGEMIGTCSYMLKTDTCAEIGYDLAKEHWGKGLMTEALETMVAYGFKKMALEKIKADTFSINTRSISLLKRLGFKLYEIKEGSHFFEIIKTDTIIEN